MEITITNAEAEDIPSVLEMMQAFNAIDQYPFDAGLWQQNLTEFTGNAALGRLFLIKQETQVIGYIVLAFGFSFEYLGRDAFIDELFIKAAFRNLGIGKQALDFIEKEAARLGVNALHLEVENHNDVANQLYFRQGFKGKNRAMLTKKLRRI